MSAQDPPDDENAKLRATVEKQARQIEILISALERREASLGRSKHSRLPSDSNHATIETMESSTIDASKKKKRRRGVALESVGPVARVAKKLDVSVAEIARMLDENYQSMRTWDARNKVPEDVKIRLDALVKPSKPSR